MYSSRLKDIFTLKIFSYLTGKIFKKIQNENGYFSVFLNDGISNSIMTSGLYEKDILVPLFEIISSEFKFENSTAIDVGANLGNHTIFFTKYFKNVISFEPNPITFNLLYVNTFFKADRITINNNGLSDEEKELNLSVSEGNIGFSTTTILRNNRINHTVKVIKLDEYLKVNKDVIKLIKIDVEGMEVNVIRGAINTIKSHKPIILFEVWKTSFKNGVSETFMLLSELGYDIYYLKETKLSKNIFIRNLKRLYLDLNINIQGKNLIKIEELSPDDYPMLIAISK